MFARLTIVDMVCLCVAFVLSVHISFQALSTVMAESRGLFSVTRLSQIQLPDCRHPWATSACMFGAASPSDFTPGYQREESVVVVVIGDRSGSVLHYQLPPHTVSASGGFGLLFVIATCCSSQMLITVGVCCD